MQFTSIVIAGGAFKVLSTIGILKYLEENNLINRLKNYVGTSAGSLICTMMVLGYTSSDIYAFIKENFVDDSHISLDIEEIFNIFDTYGMSTGIKLVSLIEKAIYKKTKLKDITFMDVAKRLGKNLVICVSNLTKECSEYLSVDTVPDMSVTQALRMSCALPFLFSPVIYKDCYYLDGGLYNNFPISYLSGSQCKDIIGINILCKNYQKTDNFISYAVFLLHTTLAKINSHSVQTDVDKNIINIELEDTNYLTSDTINLHVSIDKLNKYTDYGYKLAQERFSKQTVEHSPH